MMVHQVRTGQRLNSLLALVSISAFTSGLEGIVNAFRDASVLLVRLVVARQAILLCKEVTNAGLILACLVAQSSCWGGKRLLNRVHSLLPILLTSSGGQVRRSLQL